MSIATEITRISGLRDTIRTKLKSLGLVSDTAKLSTCATAMDSVISGVDDMSYSFPVGSTKLNTAGKCLPINLYNYEYKTNADRIHVTTGSSISYDSTYATCVLNSTKWYQLKTTATAATNNINVWHYGSSSRILIDSNGNFNTQYGAPIRIPSGLSDNVKIVFTFRFQKNSASPLLPKLRICMWDSTGAWIANDTLVENHSTDTYLAVTADLDDYYRNKDLAYITLNFVFSPSSIAVNTTYIWRIVVQWGKAAGSWYYYNATSPTLEAKTYTPTTTAQLIPGGRVLTGAQTIAGDSNLVAANIKNGVSIFGVAGSCAEYKELVSVLGSPAKTPTKKKYFPTYADPSSQSSSYYIEIPISGIYPKHITVRDSSNAVYTSTSLFCKNEVISDTNSGLNMAVFDSDGLNSLLYAMWDLTNNKLYVPVATAGSYYYYVTGYAR